MNVIKRAAAALFAMSSAAMAGQISPESWTVDDFTPGAGAWMVDEAGFSVIQTKNSLPTVLINNMSHIGERFAATVEVETTNDDDLIGFVLGFRNGDFSNPKADYLLIDWKRAPQNDPGYGPARPGLAISRVTGAATAPALFAHDPAGHVTELTRGATLGATGWEDHTPYTFTIVYTPSLIEVYVNGAKELSVKGDFPEGAFGFYNFSQWFTKYSDFRQEPAAIRQHGRASLYGPAHA